MSDRVHLDLGEYFPYLINRVGSAMVFAFTAEALAPHKLTIAMWRVLVVLADKGAQRQIDVAEATSIDASTLSRLVSRLVRAGLVTRKRSRENNREVTVALTPKGAGLVQKLVPVAKKLETRAVAGLPASELAAVKQALRRMYANLAPTPSEKTRAASA